MKAKTVLVTFAVAGLVLAGTGVSGAAPGGVYDVKDYGADATGPVARRTPLARVSEIP